MANQEIDQMLKNSSAVLKEAHDEFLRSVKDSLQKYKTETVEKTR